MTRDQVELLKRAANSVLADVAAGRHRDPDTVKWAQELLTQNPHPTPTVPYDDDLPPPWDNA